MYTGVAFLRRLASGYGKIGTPLRYFQKFRTTVGTEFANSNPAGHHVQDFNPQFARHTHQFRSNAFKFAGYGLGSLITITIVPIIMWPLADTYILPSVICQSLTKTSSMEGKQEIGNKKHAIWGREYELEQLQTMMKEDANNIWVLTGSSNSGKTALMKKLQTVQQGVIYIDLRHFFDGNAFVFEIIDSLYNNHSNSNKHNENKLFTSFSKLVGTYVKLFVFITAIMAQSNHHVTAMYVMLYFLRFIILYFFFLRLFRWLCF